MRDMIISLKGCPIMSKEAKLREFEYFLRPSHVLTVIGMSLLFIAIIYITRENIAFYLRDPAATFGFSPFAGLISNIGVFALFSAGAISVFSFFQARQDRFLLFFVGLFSIFIAIDDFFMLHEYIIPRKFGIPEIYVYIFYGINALAIIIKYIKNIFGKIHIGLYVGASLLASSVIIDVVADHVISEDIFKFCGLIVWSAYWIKRSHDSIVSLEQRGSKEVIQQPSSRRSVGVPIGSR